MSREPTWGDLQRPAKPEQSPADAEFDILTMQVLTSPSGRRWLELLREKTIERYADAATIPERALAALEAKRQLVRDFERARDRGLAASAKRATS